MKITFTLTKQDGWNHYKYARWKELRHRPARFIAERMLRYLLLWLFCALVWRLFVREFWYCLGGAFLQCMVGVIEYLFGRRKRYFRDIAKTPAWVGEWVVELGKFDLRWGNLEGAGRYYHWSAFEEVVETPNYLYLILRDKGTLFIPKAAFPDSAEAQAFVTEAITRWEAVKHRQRYQEQETVGVWPPPPHVEV